MRLVCKEDNFSLFDKTVFQGGENNADMANYDRISRDNRVDFSDSHSSLYV